MSSRGYVKLWRKLLSDSIWLNSTTEQKAVLITILLMVNHKDKKWDWEGTEFKVLPGQCVTSLERIKQKAGKGVSIQNVRSSLKRFEKLHFLTNKSTKSGRLITIVKWDSYQPKKKETTKETTNTQQRYNKDTTPNKNVRMKECKKKEKPHTSLKNYLQEKIKSENLEDTKDQILDFFEYRMKKAKAKQYQTEKGINGLFRDLAGCQQQGLNLFDCLEIAMENNWQTPKPEYFEKHNNKPVNNNKEPEWRNQWATQ